MAGDVSERKGNSTGSVPILSGGPSFQKIPLKPLKQQGAFFPKNRKKNLANQLVFEEYDG